MTPVVRRVGPYRLYFYSQDLREPAHVHVDRDDCTAKFWLEPLALASTIGFRAHEMRAVERLVSEHRHQLLEAWHAYFRTRHG